MEADKSSQPIGVGFSEGLGAWQPIATAPEKTWILTWGDWQDPPVGVSQYEDLTRVVERVEQESKNAKGRRRIVQEEQVTEREWSGSHWEPTHWMPLPAGPLERRVSHPADERDGRHHAATQARARRSWPKGQAASG